MKKLLPFLSLFVLLTAFTCDDEPLESDLQSDDTTVFFSCEETTVALATASLNFIGATDANYPELCNAYKIALLNQINACGDADGSLEVVYDGLGDCTTTESISIIGTWKIISLESNGVEELQDELDASGICFWHEVYTATTGTDIEFSGADCSTQETIDTLEYIIVNNVITFPNGDDPLEILELTDTTLKYKDTYSELGVDYVDVYTYTRQ